MKKICFKILTTSIVGLFSLGLSLSGFSFGKMQDVTKITVVKKRVADNCFVKKVCIFKKDKSKFCKKQKECVTEIK